ncbi:MAG: molybdate ABC transporter substrate-binding protein [Deltaproteobacteria bacterium RIFOXYD12_FULL_50_9]|nr:MAG: molybdate ABC transporter substrate-binding protein [Deltaproteobacteria bacterium RIFOXYD12_FULL_50_9]
MAKRIISALSLFMMLWAFVGQVNAAESTEITVSAAISLKNAFEEVGKLFESSNWGIKVLFNFGASGDLKTQIKGGAPVDVFASAALKDMDELSKEGFVLPDTKANFVTNTVVLIVPASSKISTASFEDLTRSEISKIAVGNPKTVPAGRYTEETFQYYKISEKLKDKLIFAENVRQVLDYVARGEVDAGVVYETDAIIRQQEVKVAATAPELSHKPIIYPITVIKDAKNAQAAKMFVSFVLSEGGKIILEKHGFKPVRN